MSTPRPGGILRRWAGRIPTPTRSNRRGDALRVLNRLTTLATKGYVPSYYAATVHVALGEPAKAMDLLEKSYSERSTLLGYLKMDPRFDPLRRESAFQALLSRIGL